MRKFAITDHLLTADHQLALQVPVQVQNRQMCSALFVKTFKVYNDFQ